MSNIDGSDFSGAVLRDTHLSPSNMQGVNLQNTDFEPSSLMSPNFLNDIRGLRELRLDPNDLSVARLLAQHFEEAGHPDSAADVTYALENAITRGLMDGDASLFDNITGLMRTVFLGMLLEYGLSTRRVYWLITSTILGATCFFAATIWSQATNVRRQEIFLRLPAGEPVRNQYGKFEPRSKEVLEPIRSTGVRAIIDGLFLTLLSSLKIAIGPINIAASLSDFRPVKASYSLTGRSRVLAGLITVVVPGFFALSFYY